MIPNMGEQETIEPNIAPSSAVHLRSHEGRMRYAPTPVRLIHGYNDPDVSEQETTAPNIPHHPLYTFAHVKGVCPCAPTPVMYSSSREKTAFGSSPLK